MKVIAIDKANSLLFEERPVPEPEDEEVLIRVDTVSLCGSDLHLFDGTYNGPKRYPLLFGHEWSGRVEKTGARVTRFAAGDKVTGDCSRYCGSCDLCKTDKNLCSHIEKFGITVDGASAEFILRDQKYLYKLPEGVGLAAGSLSEPLAVSANILARLARAAGGSLADKRVLVCGAGGIGLGAMLLLKHVHACRGVSVLEISPFRLRTAAALGFPAAASAAPAAEGKGGEDYADLYAGAGYDVVLETTGNAGVFASAFRRVKPLGVIGCLGMMAEAAIPQRLIVLKALTVVGSIGGTGHFEEVLGFLEKHGEEAMRMVSHSFKAARPEDAAAAFSAAKDAANAIKVQLTF